MAVQSLHHATESQTRPAAAGRLPLGRILVDSGAITPEQLVKALHLQLSLGAPLGEILVAEGWATADQIDEALAAQSGIARVDLAGAPADPALALCRPAGFWLYHRALPWRRQDGTVLIATSCPGRFNGLQRALGDAMGPVAPVQAPEAAVTGAIAAAFRTALAEGAGRRVAPQYSCRSWHWGLRLAPPLLLVLAVAGVALAPAAALAVLTVLALVTLAMFAGLKCAASLVQLADNALLTAPAPALAPVPVPAPGGVRTIKPQVSVLVPLFREREVVGALIQRLNRLTYPKALLDVILVLEEHDAITRATLAAAHLPHWIRVIEVPGHGGLTTKPRAMNYALDFCRGSIVGVWDAEDAPACDQIERVAERFACAPDDVVCLQGILDYYNPRTNWLARCFTIEYAAWFRIVLPGIARMRLVVPLGGTTLFFRRAALEALGGWDAHNVTEDADLGVRLCRRGMRTEMIGTVTYEEANCRLWPWVKQRSRWLKGFLVTYLVHMRNPAALLADLGFWRFAGFQAFFLGTLCQFLLAPVLWSFWLLLMGLPHPLESLVPVMLVYAAAGVFLVVETMSMIIGAIAVSKADRRFLMPWTPALILYFPLGTLAAFKAVCELAVAPYYWDKTEHGVAPADSCPQAGKGFSGGRRRA